MTDAWMIDVIATRISEECPWSDARKVLDHCHWRDVIEHLWRDKKLHSALVTAYIPELLAAQRDASESDSLPL